MRTLWGIDSPWHRLLWTLPTALLIWTVALWWLAYFMVKPTPQSTVLTPIDAQLVEQPVSASTRTVKQERPAALHQLKPVPAVEPQQPIAVPAQKTEVTTNGAVALPSATTPSSTHTTAGEGNTSANSGTRASSFNGPSRGDIYTSSGARAIVRPMPQIPDDMREVTFNTTALARFHIAVDGSVKVELAKPTRNPRLNRILLDSLKKWQFMPAIKNGKPVASTEDIIVKIAVQ